MQTVVSCTTIVNNQKENYLQKCSQKLSGLQVQVNTIYNEHINCIDYK